VAGYLCARRFQLQLQLLLPLLCSIEIFEYFLDAWKLFAMAKRQAAAYRTYIYIQEQELEQEQAHPCSPWPCPGRNL